MCFSLNYTKVNTQAALVLILTGALEAFSLNEPYTVCQFHCEYEWQISICYSTDRYMWIMYLPLQAPWLTTYNTEALMCTVHCGPNMHIV